MNVELMFVLLFSVATAVAIVARWLKLPYTVALVLAGLLIGSAHLVEAPHLTRELLFAVILPGLLFEAAFHLEFRRFWADKVTIGSLAVPGLVVSVALTALLLLWLTGVFHFAENFSLGSALVFGALISATDPIAVIGLFKLVGAPKRLATLVEGESLVNDGTGVVLFTIALALASGQEVTFWSGLADFVRIAGLGIVVGAAIGYAASLVILKIDEAMLELTVTMIAAYGSFAIAEHFGVSGVMATVTAGLLCGNYAARVGMSPTTRVAVETFWEYLAFALNSMVFLLIGLEVEIGEVLSSWQPIVIAFIATLAGRFAVVFAVTTLMRRSAAPVLFKESVVLGWAGLRGALSMVLVLSLPYSFEHRAFLLHLTFGVVLLSIFIQGLTMSPLLRRLGLVSSPTGEKAVWAELRAKAHSTRAGLKELERLRATVSMPAVTYDELKAELVERQHAAEAQLTELRGSKRWLETEDVRDWRRSLMRAERQAVLDAQRHGSVADESAARLIAEIDAGLSSLEQHQPEQTAPVKAPAESKSIT